MADDRIRIDYNDPRYPFIKRATEQFVQRDVDMIPSVLFEELAKLREDQDAVLQLIDGGGKVCPNCGYEVEAGDAILDDEGDETDEYAWQCDSCEHNNETDDVTYADLPAQGAVHGWPGAHGTCFWVRSEAIARHAADAGFLVYEPVDFDGAILAIDGGGYDFYDQHWIPLYLSLGFKWHEQENGWNAAVNSTIVHVRKAP